MALFGTNEFCVNFKQTAEAPIFGRGVLRSILVATSTDDQLRTYLGCRAPGAHRTIAGGGIGAVEASETRRATTTF